MLLSSIGLQLVAQTPHIRQVLLPHRTRLSLLHKGMEAQGFDVQQQPLACQAALLVERELVRRQWLRSNRLEPVVDMPVLEECLWLLLSQGTAETTAAQLAWQGLREQVARAKS